MQKSELVVQFDAFIHRSNDQENSEVGLAYYLGWYFIMQVPNEYEQNSIIPDVPRFIAEAMKNLRESNDLRITKFRQKYLAVRGEREIIDLEGISQLNAEQEAMITFVSQLMGKITGDNLVEQLIAAYLRSPVARNARIRELHTTFANLVEKDQTASSLRQAEVTAKQAFEAAYRAFLLAEVNAAYKNMFIVQLTTNNFFSKVHTFAIANLASGHSFDTYDVGPVHVFDKQEVRNLSTWIEMRNEWLRSPKTTSFFWNTWIDAAHWYTYLYQNCWFAFNNSLVLNIQNWVKNTREVYWQRQFTATESLTDSIFETRTVERFKVENQTLYLDVWEINYGTAQYWYSANTETVLANRIQQLETDSNISVNSFHRDDPFRNDLMNEYSAAVQAYSQWKEAKKKANDISVQLQAAREQKNKVQQELSTLFQTQAGNTTTQYWFQQGQTVFGSYTEAQMLSYIANRTVVSDTQVNVNGAGWTVANQILAFRDALTMPQIHAVPQQYSGYSDGNSQSSSAWQEKEYSDGDDQSSSDSYR